MKYIVMLGDGMADEPIDELEGKTPIAVAKTPHIDTLSRVSEIGMVHTIPKGMKPGSDTANLSVLGYDPKIYYSGRSPLEALSIGVDMEDTDVAIRCNVVTISEEDVPFEQQTIIDHSASEISTEDAAILLDAVKAELENEIYKFYVGTSYRHCLIWKEGKVVELTPPHDVLGRVVGEYLPEDAMLRKMMEVSYGILKDHPINKARKEAGLNPANCCWFWGAGTKPILDDFYTKTGKTGAMISAVDLLKGIAIGAKMNVIEVEGANGGLNTNYTGKKDAAVKALLEDENDFVYIHVEAPDEMGHQGSYERKIKAIENIDSYIVGPLVEELQGRDVDFRLLVLPDHPTPVRLRTHTSDAVPYMLYDSTMEVEGGVNYCEKNAKETENYFDEGYLLMNHFLEIDK
ncbi:MAG: cofactor-independent phosphoglycerate mutase [Lachnospiraceae bacterium]|nr:cofactor-independent phosphoglycerate mutase [Lachnospiraceae bacterium]